jgi:hypothetical protein
MPNPVSPVHVQNSSGTAALALLASYSRCVLLPDVAKMYCYHMTRLLRCLEQRDQYRMNIRRCVITTSGYHPPHPNYTRAAVYQTPMEWTTAVFWGQPTCTWLVTSLSMPGLHKLAQHQIGAEAASAYSHGNRSSTAAAAAAAAMAS